MIYNIISNETADGLQTQVNQAIKSGWQPLGGVSVVNSPIAPVEFCQAMTIKEKRQVKELAITADHVVLLWNEHFENTKARSVRVLSEKLKKRIEAVIRKAYPDLTDWRQYFAYIRKSPFLMGIEYTGKPFIITLEWVCNDNNMSKILNGQYHGEG